MRRWLLLLLCLLPVSLQGCAQPSAHRGISAGQAVSAPVSTPAPDASPTVALPALPHWGEPGSMLGDGTQAWSPSYAFAPFPVTKVSVQGVATLDGTYFYALRDGAVYLVGIETDRGGFFPVEPAQLLYRLPLKVGDQWDEKLHDRTFRVAAVESVKTPGGERLAARLDVTTGGGRFVRSEWIVPGYGTVRLERPDKPVWVAVKEVRETPQQVPQLGRATATTTALIVDNGRVFLVVTTDSGKELFRVSDSYWRSWYAWRSAGSSDLLTHTTFPGTGAIYQYEALRFDAQAGQFAEVAWVGAGGQRTKGVSGSGEWKDGPALALKQNDSYPTSYSTFKFDGVAMRADPAAERAEYAASAKELVDRLLNPPQLSKANFVSLFEQAAAGERAYALLRADPYTTWSVKADGADTFSISDFNQPPVCRLQVALRNGQYKVIAFLPAK